MDAFGENFNELPFDVEAEQSVLGAILLEPNCMTTVLEYVTVEPLQFTSLHADQ